MKLKSLYQKMKAIKAKSHKAQVKHHLVSGGKLTDWTSLQLFGYQRLAARIEELRADGMRIKTQMISVSCRNGRIAKVAEYRMEEA